MTDRQIWLLTAAIMLVLVAAIVATALTSNKNCYDPRTDQVFVCND